MKTSLIKAIETKDAAKLTNALTGFTYKAKANKLEASNNYLDLNMLEAYSYNWWVYVKNINGLMVFNNYPYSNTTRKHQSKMRSLLARLGIRVDLYIKTKSSLSNFSIEDVKQALLAEILSVESELAKCKRKVSAKRTELENQIYLLKDDLNSIESLVKASRKKSLKAVQ